tara:strand:- start:9 stop:179 length:171 start_codon:yes stop_codon:yes gene_type:complete
MNIENAKYNAVDGVNVSINATVKGKELSIPLTSTNRYYREILRQVKNGTLTIKDAD